MMSETETKMMAAHRARQPRPPGFLGFYTNKFDRYFISVVLAIAFGLVYLRFLAPLGVPSFVSWGIVIAATVFIVRKG
jgi:predicted small integral membrane protein